jgi:transposase
MRKQGHKGTFIMQAKVYEIIRLWESGYNKSQISASVKVHRKTVRDYVSKSKAHNLRSEAVRDLSKEKYEEIFCPNNAGRKQVKRDLDYQHIARELKKRGVTLVLLWEEYLRDNTGGSVGYSRFCDLYNAWGNKQSISMRVVHKAGEKCFVDYSGKRVPIYAENSIDIEFEAEVFVGVLGGSGYTFAEASFSQGLEDWIGSHVRMFEYFGGVSEILVPDNLKSGVTKPDYYEPGINKTYQDFASHYCVAVIPARVRKPKDKSKVEQGVQGIQRRVLAVLRNQKFYSLGDLNSEVRRLLIEYNHREMKSYGKSRHELFLELEKSELKPLPVNRYEFARYQVAKVHIDYHVQINHNFYSVSYEHVGREVDVRVSEKTVEIFYGNSRIAIHPRFLAKAKHQYHTIKEHMPSKHRYMESWTPARFLSWASSIGPETQLQINSILLCRQAVEQSYRSCLAVLSLSKKHGNYRLECACKKANDFGATSAKSIKKILENNTLDNQVEEQEPIVHSHLRRDVEFH